MTENEARLEEDKKVKMLMLEYGIDFVRGGTYAECNMHAHRVSTLRSEINHATNRCLRCGRTGHWMQQCYARTFVNGNRIISEEVDTSEDELEDGELVSVTYDDACFRCGRVGHWADHCYARTNVSGRALH